MSSDETANLLAVLLITYSRAGPRLVFQYSNASNRNLYEAELAPVTSNGGAPSARNVHGEIKRPMGEERQSADGRIFGLSNENLERLLSPGRWCDRKRFEVSLGDLLFIGHPVFSDGDGSWTRKHDRTGEGATEEQRPSTSRNTRDHENDPNTSSTEPSKPGITIVQPTPAKAPTDFKHIPESLDSRSGLSFGASINSQSTASANLVPESLTAIHVIFAMSRTRDDHGSHLNVNELYKQVVKKLTKALIHCQKESSYIGVESGILAQLKIKAKQEGWTADALMSVMTEKSELASALKEIYEKISESKIANFRLKGMTMSLQIRSVSDRDQESERIEPNKTVLLLEDKDVLLRELTHPDASPLAHFIREYTPSKSLQKQTTRLGMPINNILFLAQHLIKWQKGRAIQPLHPRNTYIVGREAPLDQLNVYIPDYAKRFAGLPSLPQVLKVLSGKPVKYGMLIPSRDHRAPYTDILAYLVRYKFVEQLKTSGWLQAPPTKSISSGIEEDSNRNRRPLSVTSLLSPQMRAIADDDVASVSSERTAIPISVLDSRGTGAAPSPASRVTSGEHGDEQESVGIIVKDPLNPSEQERRCLEHITNNIQDDDLRDRLPSFYRYLDGVAAMESIAAQEGLKRSVMDGWLDVLLQQGFLLTFRHL